MTDMEKVIKGLEELEGFLFKEYTNIKAEESKIYYDRFKSISDALALLKEQEAVYGLHHVDYITIVRCKDCKHWYFADNRIPCEQENVCGRNGIVVTPDWFCADGERNET